MTGGTSTRSTHHKALTGVLCGVVAAGLLLSEALAERPVFRSFQNRQERGVPPREALRPSAPHPPGSKPGGVNQARGHIAQWMQSHSGMTLEEQQRALAAEPGFHQLQPEVQQRMHDRLTQLNQMSPEQRQRTIERTEAMERLTPPQRQQVRSALTDLGALPEERRRFVARTFRQLRDLPEAQRNAYLNAYQVRGQFSEQERGVLNNLFAAEPYLPSPSAPPSGPQAPR